MILYWLIDLGSRAAQHQPLTPQERSVLRLIDSLLVGALSAALVAVLPLLVGQHVPTLQVLLSLGGTTFLQALALAALKLIRAGGDPALPASVAPVQQPPATETANG